MAIVRRAALIFLPLAAIAACVTYLLYLAQAKAIRAEGDAFERRLVATAEQRLAQTLMIILSDALYLATQEALLSWLEAGDADALRHLRNEHLAFAGSKAIYDRIRLLDDNGQEISRIDWNRGTPAIAAPSSLRNQAALPAFRQTIALGPGQLAATQLTLVDDPLAPEGPQSPVICVSAAVFDARGRKRGIVILDYRGQRLIDRITSLSGEMSLVWLVDDRGNWLIGPAADGGVAFLPIADTGGRDSFATAFPDVWRAIRDGLASGITESAPGRFNYVKVDPDDYRPVALAQAQTRQAVDGPSWIAIVHTSRDVLWARTAQLRLYVAAATVVLLLLLAGVAVGLARHQLQRRESERKIQELNHRLLRDNAELEALNRELEAFSYSVSHDLRAPLRAIDGFSRALLEDAGDRLDHGSRSHLDRVRSAVHRMEMLIADLLKLASASRLDLNKDVVDLTALTGEIARDLAASDPERDARIEVAPGLRASADPHLLRIALENLLSNAWKFTAQRAPAFISIGQEATGAGPAFFVRDNGIGFDMAQAARLFRPFQRLHNGQHFPGTGIGLATAQRVIRRHGGDIWARSRSGEGATFFFTLSGPGDA